MEMGKKYLIVGGVAGGASVAARLRRLDESADITMLERGRDVSFSNCALPYFLGGEIASSGELLLMDPDTFWRRYRIRALTFHEAVKIDRARKTVRVKNLEKGSEEDLPYDALFLSPGASPILPPTCPGADLPHVFTVRNVTGVERIDAYVREHRVREAVVIGGGFIGLEVMENLVTAGLRVALADMAPQVMLPLDMDMAQLLHKEILEHGADLRLGDGVAAVDREGVTLSSGARLPAQMVIMAIGVRPETTLAHDARLEIGKTGAILVDGEMRTSDPDIFAVGDAIEVRHRLTGKKNRLALAGPALRQARQAANVAGGVTESLGDVLGSSVLRVFSLNAASTGLNERQCETEGLDFAVSFVVPADRVGIMPGASPVFFKLIYEKPTGRVLGAQAVGRGAVDKRIDVVATAMRFGATVWDLKDLDLAYAPHFSSARDVVHHAALSACDQLQGLVSAVPFSRVRGLHAQGAFFLDVREKEEYDFGHILGSLNIPLGELRERLREVPKDRPVYVLCRTGQRSYNAVRALMQLGFDNVHNVAGSFLALSWFEQPQDRMQGRAPILSGYNYD